MDYQARIINDFKVSGHATFSGRINASNFGINTPGTIKDMNENLIIGVQNDETKISVPERPTRVQGELNVEDNLYINGAVRCEDQLKVEADAEDYAVKVKNVSAGELSTGIETAGVIALRASGKVVVDKEQVVLDGSSDLSVGSGFVYNSEGHGEGPSIDFYIGGERVGYIDRTGWR